MVVLKDFKDLIQYVFTIKHGKYIFSDKQVALLNDLDDLFLSDVKDRIRDFEKSII